jgi:hypothetical protein
MRGRETEAGAGRSRRAEQWLSRPPVCCTVRPPAASAHSRVRISCGPKNCVSQLNSRYVTVFDVTNAGCLYHCSLPALQWDGRCHVCPMLRSRYQLLLTVSPFLYLSADVTWFMSFVQLCVVFSAVQHDSRLATAPCPAFVIYYQHFQLVLKLLFRLGLSLHRFNRIAFYKSNILRRTNHVCYV